MKNKAGNPGHTDYPDHPDCPDCPDRSSSSSSSKPWSGRRLARRLYTGKALFAPQPEILGKKCLQGRCSLCSFPSLDRQLPRSPYLFRQGQVQVLAGQIGVLPGSVLNIEETDIRRSATPPRKGCSTTWLPGQRTVSFPVRLFATGKPVVQTA